MSAPISKGMPTHTEQRKQLAVCFFSRGLFACNVYNGNQLYHVNNVELIVQTNQTDDSTGRTEFAKKLIIH